MTRTLSPEVLLLLVVAVMAEGCATVTGAPGPAADAPVYRVGDRWVYRVHDRVPPRLDSWEETHTIATVSAQAITLQVVAKGASVDVDRTETWSMPGTVVTGAVFDLETRRFDPPLLRFRFPLAVGDRWNQRMEHAAMSESPYGALQRSVTVAGYQRITTPAGTFDAIRMNIFMRMDDETFWRWPTQCTYVVWYAPAVGTTVREEKYAYYSEKGGHNGSGHLVTQRTTVELISLSRGG
jgi:hypothetical protein